MNRRSSQPAGMCRLPRTRRQGFQEGVEQSVSGLTNDNFRLLIIEDDADQRDLMRETLEDHFGKGTVATVGCARDALAQAHEQFDLILCDYNLPDASGMDVLRKIVARCATPVLMVTGENVGHIAAEAIRNGATDYVVKTGEYLFTIPLVVEKSLTLAKIKRENESLHRELELALAALQEKHHALEESLQRVEELAATDPLTGLCNRRHFGRILDQLFAEAERYGKDLSCAMIDLDGYKQMNDSFGHQMGDQLLVLCGKVVSANMRRMDTAARYGGDEFVLLLPHASQEEAARVAGRIRDEFVSASGALLGGVGLTMSVGVASRITASPAGGDQLVALADAALYRAKEQGRDRIVISSGAALVEAR